MKTFPEYPNLFVVNHPLIQHKLTRMREKDTSVHEFRELLREISLLMSYEPTKNLKLTGKTIITPVTEMHDAPVLAEDPPTLVPILRSGLFMADGIMEHIISDASIGYVGMYRDPETKKPVEYYVKLPPNNGQHFFLVDPMFATGGSAIDAIKVLEKHKVAREKITFVALIGTFDAVKAFCSEFPDIPIYIAAIDDYLNENKYIVPGIGDAGDRLAGTL